MVAGQHPPHLRERHEGVAPPALPDHRRISPTSECGAPPVDLVLPREGRSVALARRFAVDRVRERIPDPPDELLDAVRLVTSELATNGVKYGARDDDLIGVTVRVAPDRVRVEVHDPNRRRPRPRGAADRQRRNHGNGLHIVAALTGGRWGVGPRPLGKYVWAEIPRER
ncbi:ATP-binding protein [Streptomyces chilikensis]|uniref:ATP-binding protein n=1 Tax=Streptomyces chilikensis TaxID=1194079 RepID=UPI00140D12AA|nr:ATP-binding protein [Streptomyces chilikensis]